MDEINPLIDLAKLIGAGVIGGLIGAFIAHRFTVLRERTAGKATRKREFIAFMRAWRYEIDRLHFVGRGFERRTSSFFDEVSAFHAATEIICRDFIGKKRKRFDELIGAISRRSDNRYTYEHDELVKAFDEVISFVDRA